MKGENIYQRKDGRWEARYIKKRMPNGQIVFGSCYGKTYKEAKEKREQVKIQLYHDKALVYEKEASFAEYCDEWLDAAWLRVKYSSYSRYKSQVDLHIKPYFKDYLPLEIDSKLIDAFTQHLLVNEKLNVKSTRDVLVRLKSIIKMVVLRYPDKMKYIEIAYPQLEISERRVLTKAEQKRLKAYLLDNLDTVKFGILLALYSGIRIGELCALKWSDISLEENLIKVRKTMQRVSDPNKKRQTKVIITTAKSKKSNRDIPLIQSVKQYIPEVYSAKNDFVLTGSTHFMEPRQMQYKIKKLSKELKIPDMHFHCFRHTFATRCIEVGFDIKTLSEILGHSSIKLTMDLYVHSSLEQKRLHMDKLRF